MSYKQLMIAHKSILIPHSFYPAAYLPQQYLLSAQRFVNVTTNNASFSRGPEKYTPGALLVLANRRLMVALHELPDFLKQRGIGVHAPKIQGVRPVREHGHRNGRVVVGAEVARHVTLL